MSQATPPLIRAHGLGHRFPNGLQALADLDLELLPGEFLTLIGPSGCGKSTLLRLIAGLLPAAQGQLERPPRLPCGFVFQSPTLLPWRTVEANVSLPLELEGISRRDAKERARELLSLVGLTDSVKAFPAQLSGGMRMRVSIARALAVRPSLLLLDEPFAALDDITRNRLQEDLLSLRSREGFTTLMVTHNIAEAAFLSDRVLVVTPRPGRIHAEVEVPFGPVRDTELRTSAELAAVCRAISHRLKECAA